MSALVMRTLVYHVNYIKDALPEDDIPALYPNGKPKIPIGAIALSAAAVCFQCIGHTHTVT